MTSVQFRVLYRQFLFRVVDLELLSAYAQGDASKLLGQFTALLIYSGLLLGMGVLGIGDNRTPHAQTLVQAWGLEHFDIATTMLVVGLFAVLSWDTTFPDRRDAFVLAPLPVRARTLFLAKVAASATALSVTVVALNAPTSLLWPLALAPPTSSIFDMLITPEVYRTFFAYWTTVFAASAFIFGSVLCLQGITAQVLPRRLYLRVSGLLQMAAFGTLICVYFLQPSLVTPEAVAAPANRTLLDWLPSYWFLGLFQKLNGSMHPSLVPLVQKAWTGTAIVACGAAVAYLLSYFRTLRKIIEQPDILPGARVSWLPRFGNPFETAIAQFSIRTLLRSRQHRMVLAFYLGVGFAITVLFLKTPVQGGPMHRVSAALLISSIAIAIAWIVGTRVAISLPFDLRANWIFRIMSLPIGRPTLAARRRALTVLAVAPMWGISTAVFLCNWPTKPAAIHLIVLGFLAVLIVELCLRGPQKLPFTCAWLPGRSNFHLTFLGAAFFMIAIGRGAQAELYAITHPASAMLIILILGALLAVVRWQNALAPSADTNS